MKRWTALAFGPILLQKSKIVQPLKSRESRSLAFSAAASLFNAATKVSARFWMKRYGPSHRRAHNASAALRIFVRHPKKTFATKSANCRHKSSSCPSDHRTRPSEQSHRELGAIAKFAVDRDGAAVLLRYDF